MKKIAIFFISLLLSQISTAQTAEECFRKGEDYNYGRNGATQSAYEASKWYQKASDMGYAQAQFQLGYVSYEGRWIKELCKDTLEIFDLFQKSANQGFPQAQYYLGLLYIRGHGTSVNYSKAANWLKKAANQDNVEAKAELGYLYENGIGVKKNYDTAIELYQEAANRGIYMAQFNLANMYEKGKGIEQDYNEALKLYIKAAKQNNNNEVYIKVADLYLMKKDYENAAIWYRKCRYSRPDSYSNLKLDSLYNNGYISSKYTPDRKANNNSNQVNTNNNQENNVKNNTFAIIIANEDYQNEKKADYAQNDGEEFKNCCNITLDIPERNIHYVQNATLNNIIGELDWLQQVCEAFDGDACVIFYYSGHGIPDEASGAAYLLPIDGNSRILRTCFSVEELYATLGKLPAKKVTVMMDACFSGAVRSGGMLASARGVAIKAKTTKPLGNMIVLSAAQGNETAYKYDDAKHGLFTYYLLKKLNESNGNVTLGDLCDYVIKQVKRESIVVNGKIQTPSVLISDKLKQTWEKSKLY